MSEPPAVPDVLQLTDGHVELASRRVVRRGHTATLTTLEAALLGYLAARAGRAVSTEALLRDVWGYDPATVTRAPFHVMRRLRAKVEVEPSAPRHLHTVHGVGYRFEPARATPPTRPADAEESPRAVPAPPHRAPTLGRPYNVLVGRSDALDRLTRAFADGARLVTITGTAGAGKTRLALEFLHGAAWPSVVCDAAADLDGVDLRSTVHLALGFEPPAPDAVALARAVRGRGAFVLLLDNLEQVTAPAADLVATLLRGAPDLRVLATSRVPLHLGAEQLLPLEPLPVPASDAPLDTVRASDAVRLLVARARAVRPDFALDATNRAAVVALVRSLDGLPLAVELAAARLRALSPAALLSALTSDAGTLRSRRRDLPPRHATLEAALAWSWSLLDDEARSVFAAIAVFVSPFSLDAAACVTDRPAGAVLPVLEDLVDHSLLVAVPDRGDGRPHFRTLVTVREFARRRLDERGATADEARHGRWMARHGALPRLAALNDEGGWRRHALLAELDDVRVAAHRAVRRGDEDVAISAARAIAAIEAARDVASAVRQPLELRARASSAHAGAAAVGWLWSRSGIQALGLSVDDLASDRAAADAAGDAALACVATANLALAQHDQGDLEAGLASLDDALDQARSALPALTGALHAVRANLLRGDLRLDAAERDLARARAWFDARGDLRGSAYVQNIQGLTALQRGDLPLAEARLRAALREATTTLDEPRLAALSSGNLAIVAQHRGDLEGARERLSGALGHFQRAGDARMEALTRCNLGATHLQLGETDRAIAELEDATALQRDAAHALRAITGVNLAEALLRRGDTARAEAVAAEAVAAARSARHPLLEPSARALHAIARGADPRGALDALGPHDPGEAAKLLGIAGEVAAARGDHAGARAALAELDDRLAALGDRAPHAVRQVRDRLGAALRT